MRAEGLGLLLGADLENTNANEFGWKAVLGSSQRITEKSHAFKIDHCLITHVLNEINITCLPADLPEFIEVDLAGLKKGTSFHLSDVKLPNGVKTIVKGRENPVLVSVVTSAAEASAEATAEAAAAAPAGKGGKGGKAAPAAKAPAAKAPAAKAPAAKK